MNDGKKATPAIVPDTIGKKPPQQKPKAFKLPSRPGRRNPRPQSDPQLVVIEWSIAKTKRELDALTGDKESQQAQPVRAGPNSKRNRTTDDKKRQADTDGDKSEKTEQSVAAHSTLLTLLNTLNVPKELPPEIVRLEHLLTLAVTLKKEEKQAFVDGVNELMNTSNYCYVIEPDDARAKLLYLNTTSSENGDIEFQLTSGLKRGFKNAKYKIVPYVRPYSKKQK